MENYWNISALMDLCLLGVNIEDKFILAIYSTVGAAVCRRRLTQDGNLSFGESLAACLKENDRNLEDNLKNLRLRRLLACEGVQELCQVLRPILALIQSRSVQISYSEILKDLLDFRWDNKRKSVKLHWAKDFYNKTINEDGTIMD